MLNDNIISGNFDSDANSDDNLDVSSAREEIPEGAQDKNCLPLTCEQRLQIANDYAASDLAVLPMQPFKRPMLKGWTSADLLAEESARKYWFLAQKALGIGIRTGEVSSNLVVLDFEYKHIYEQWRARIIANGKNVLLNGAPVVKTPGDGIHVYVRLEYAPPAGKHLAKRILNGKEDLLAEFRGEGHCVMAPGSAAECHPENGPYELTLGSFKSIPVISLEDFSLFIGEIESFDEMPKSEPKSYKASANISELIGTESPVVADFNGSRTFGEVLARNGFRFVRSDGPESYWSKPGATNNDHHCTFNNKDDGKFRNFSTNNPPFEVRTYSAFEAYVLVEHEGDSAAAEAALKQEGFGASLWGEPDEFQEAVGIIAPSMSPELLPEPIKPWVLDVSDRLQVRLERVAINLIVVLASIIATRCGIRPRQHDNWLVIPNLWGVDIGPPGTLKTAIQYEALSLLGPLQEAANKIYDEEIAQYRIDLESYRLQVDKLKHEFKKSGSKMTPGMFSSALEAISEPKEPKKLRYDTNEASTQKLTELLAGNKCRGILYARDELAGWLAELDKSGHEGDKAYFNKAWNGFMAHSDDKIGRGSTYVARQCISILGGLQPDLMQAYLIKSLKKLSNDGNVQRFQLAVFSEDLKRDYVDSLPDAEARSKLEIIVAGLDTLNFTDVGAVQESEGSIPFYRFCPDAQDYFKSWSIVLEERIALEPNQFIREHLSKFPKLIASLALIFHLIDVADAEIKDTSQGVSYNAIRLAGAWCELLEAHARKSYGLLDSAHKKAVTAIATKIKSGALKDGFSVRDIRRHEWKALTENDLIKTAVEELVDANWIMPIITAKGFQQPATTTYRVNPKIELQTK